MSLFSKYSVPADRLRRQIAPLLLILLAAAAVPLNAHAAGMTTHVSIGEKAITELTNIDLADLLRNNRNAFRSGSIFPDMALGYFGKMGGSWKSSADSLSHGSETGTLGILNEYLLQLQAACPSLTDTAECREATAFFMGMLNHDAADGPWHQTFIFHTLKSTCEPGITDSDYWHKFADGDIDTCLAKQLNDFPAYSYFRKKPSLTGGFDVNIFTIPTSQSALAAKCPSSRELATMGCYSCPGGYTFGSSGPAKGCYKDVKYTTKMVKSGGSVPKQYWYIGDGKWYGCPSGYKHDGGVFFNLTGICYKWVHYTADATFKSFPNQSVPLCNSGEALSGGCYSCTDDYTYPNELRDQGVVDPTQQACYKVVTGVVDCDLIAKTSLPAVPRTFDEYFELNPYVTAYIGTQDANAASFPANSAIGYTYAYNAYTAMGKGGAFSSSATLRNSADDTLDNSFKKEHAIPLTPKQTPDPDEPFTAKAKECDWAYLHLPDAAGGFDDSARASALLLDAVWTALKNGSRVGDVLHPLAVWRTDGLNYGVFENGHATACIYDSGCAGTELRYAEAGADGVVSTASTTANIVDTAVTTPNSGFVSIFEQSHKANGSDLKVKIVAPSASAAAPLTVDFLFRLASGPTLSVYRNGTLAAACADSSGAAAPDPCLAAETADPAGIHITVLSSRDGAYSFKEDGGALNLDSDGDGVLDSEDNCPLVVNPDQADTDGDGTGNACYADDDTDLVDDLSDNCPRVANADQTDTDGDGQGDACDLDDDGDGMPDAWETTYGLDATVAASPEQDTDNDGMTDLEEYQKGTDPIIADQVLPVVVLLEPVNEAANLAAPLAFTWKKVDAGGHPVRYDLYLCKEDPDFGAPCDVPVNAPTATASAAGRALAGSGAGLFLAGLVFAGSITRKQKLGILLLALVLAGSPAACRNSPGPATDTVTVSHTVYALDPAATYYWKVVAIDKTEAYTSTSEVRSFTTR
jgi:hypothetical protein